MGCRVVRVGAFKQTITQFPPRGLNRTTVLELATPLLVALLICLG
jgi:hypothetical protein